MCVKGTGVVVSNELVKYWYIHQYLSMNLFSVVNKKKSHFNVDSFVVVFQFLDVIRVASMTLRNPLKFKGFKGLTVVFIVESSGVSGRLCVKGISKMTGESEKWGKRVPLRQSENQCHSNRRETPGGTSVRLGSTMQRGLALTHLHILTYHIEKEWRR